MKRRVLAFYRFFDVAEPGTLADALRAAGEALGLRGTVLVAREGVNGTLTAEPAALEAMCRELERYCGAMPWKWSDVDEDTPGFLKFKVRVKPEIVSFGPPVDIGMTGEHVDPATWHALLDDPSVTVVDTRNRYEVAIGTFPGALAPGTGSFRDFPAWADAHLDPTRDGKVAMFCTGGIRCEKASAYLRERGFENVYQLDGGILNYLEQVPADESRWQGECFVFDQRVSVDASLKQGRFVQCHACRHPLSKADQASDAYEEGVACPHCIDDLSEARRSSLEERRRQVRLARQRGESHVGVPQPQHRSKRPDIDADASAGSGSSFGAEG